MNKPIYLDNHATTPLDPDVFLEMLPYLKDNFGNASSIESFYGNQAKEAVEIAREKIARVIGASSDDIIFTGGATESDNLALFGICETLKQKGNHLITTKIEHKAILDTCKKLESKGYNITYLDVNKDGIIEIEELKKSINPKTILISIMSANNEIGTLQPLKEIGKIAKEKNILFHTDAAQAFGYIPLNVKDMNIDLMSISSHKIYGPKGIGALYVNKGIKLEPLFYGGGQERGLRPGTLNVPAIVGFGKAAELSQKDHEKLSNLEQLRNRLYKSISSKVKVEVNGSMTKRLPHNLSLYLEDINSKALINEVKNLVTISAGSACTTLAIHPSHVILALGYDEERAFSTIRFGLGKFTTEEDIDKTIKIITDAVNKLKNL